jgi:hypothetical protein
VKFVIYLNGQNGKILVPIVKLIVKDLEIISVEIVVIKKLKNKLKHITRIVHVFITTQIIRFTFLHLFI